MEHCWVIRIRSTKLRRKSSNMTILWRRTTSRSRCGSTQSSQCRSRWQPREWSTPDFWEVLTDGLISARIVQRWGTADFFPWSSWKRLAVGIARRSRTATSGMARWKTSKGASAAKSGFTSKSFAFSCCWTCLLQFSLLGEYVKVSTADYAIVNFLSLRSFIIFPQILYDGFQAQSANESTVNQSLPSFEFVDLLTADVSKVFSAFLSTSFKLRLSSSSIGYQTRVQLESNFEEHQNFFLSFTLSLAHLKLLENNVAQVKDQILLRYKNVAA